MEPDEETVQRLADEAERGYDVDVLLNARESTAARARDRGPIRPPMSHERQRNRAEVIISAELVKERRKRIGYTQHQLAIAAATSPATIAKIERGKSFDPPTSVTLRLAKALSTTVEALCRDARPYTSRTATPPVTHPEV